MARIARCAALSAASVVLAGLLAAGCYHDGELVRTADRFEARETRTMRAYQQLVRASMEGGSVSLEAVEVPVCRQAALGSLIVQESGNRKVDRTPGLIMALVGAAASVTALFEPMGADGLGDYGTGHWIVIGAGAGLGVAGLVTAFAVPDTKPEERTREVPGHARWSGEAAQCGDPVPLDGGTFMVTARAGDKVVPFSVAVGPDGRAAIPAGGLRSWAGSCRRPVVLEVELVGAPGNPGPARWRDTPLGFFDGTRFGAAPVTASIAPGEARPPAGADPQLVAAIAECAIEREKADEALQAAHPEAGDGAIYVWLSYRDFEDNRRPTGLPLAVAEGEIRFLLRARGPLLGERTDFDLRKELEHQVEAHLERILPARGNGTPRGLAALGSYHAVAGRRADELGRCVSECRRTAGRIPSLRIRRTPNMAAFLGRALREDWKPPPLGAELAQSVSRLAAASCGCGGRRGADGICPPGTEPAEMPRRCDLRRGVSCVCPVRAELPSPGP